MKNLTFRSYGLLRQPSLAVEYLSAILYLVNGCRLVYLSTYSVATLGSKSSTRVSLFLEGEEQTYELFDVGNEPELHATANSHFHNIHA